MEISLLPHPEYETQSHRGRGVEVAAAMHAFFKDDYSLTAWKSVSALLDLMMCFGAKPFPVAAAKRATQACCMLFAALSQEAQRLGKQTWRIKPKLHMLQELGEFQVDEMGDPSLFWAYKDEDYVGLCATIGFSCGGGGSAATTPQCIVDRFRALV